MKLNIIKIKELKIKIYYFYEKKRLFEKKLSRKDNKSNKKINRDI